jgi:SAM-dependent methyltransferase
VTRRDYLGRPVTRAEYLAKRARRLLQPRSALWRRPKPLSDRWGTDRGNMPVDRHYIEAFLAGNRAAIRGRVLEVKEPVYTNLFGADVSEGHVLDIDASNRRATYVADLASADAIPSDAFDCFILTQTLQFIYDLEAAAAHAHRILRPGGVLLCTVPSVSRIEPGSVENEYWRFTTASCAHLFEAAFPGGAVIVRSHGNVLVSIAFLAGMAAEELRQSQLDENDPHFPLIVTVRAEKRR